MTTPWQKLRDNIATRTALEGLVLFDNGVQALTDAQTRGSSINEQNIDNAGGYGPGTTEAISPNASKFYTSPCPSAPLANWNQNMLSRPNKPAYYNTNLNGNPSPVQPARCTFSSESLVAPPPQSQCPQSAYDALPPSLRPGPHPTMQRPLTEYERPSPSVFLGPTTSHLCIDKGLYTVIE
ncbi:hypothetical protein FRC11_001528 [Ceratobasidium sp. 423]|nr:hypothetical protein FRC11_001528 [Ceratobasidium sp. 423]